MSYEVRLTKTFQKSLKILKKKHPRVKDDLLSTIQALEEDPTIGDPIPGWKKEIWKIRTASSDVKKGKRGGFSVGLSLEIRRELSVSFGGIFQGT